MEKKILILDDDKDVLDMLEEVLLYENFEVRTVNSLADFLRAFDEDFDPDLVVIDYLLTGINGGELCYQLKTNEETKDLPVILMSAYPQVFESLGDYKCDEFIAKPFDLYHLISRVKSHVGYTGVKRSETLLSKNKKPGDQIAGTQG
jgi:DNA-binding response OmpR family regulator